VATVGFDTSGTETGLALPVRAVVAAALAVLRLRELASFFGAFFAGLSSSLIGTIPI
jgi:hypothetical protein